MCKSDFKIKTDNIYFFRSKLKSCPYCNNKLYVAHHTHLREIITMKGNIKAKQITLKCINPECFAADPSKRRYFPSTQYQTLSLPKCDIGLDITLFIGYQMHIKHQSLDEVHKMLLPIYSGLNRSTVYRHYRYYRNYLQELSEIEKGELKEKIKSNKGYVLSVDAVHIEGAPALLLVRDIITKSVLLTKHMETENEKDIIPLFKQIKEEYGNPLAIISDMGHGIHKSIKEVFSEVKHQYCHYHFLSNLGKALLESDYIKLKELTKENKKK